MGEAALRLIFSVRTGEQQIISYRISFRSYGCNPQTVHPLFMISTKRGPAFSPSFPRTANPTTNIFVHRNIKGVLTVASMPRPYAKRSTSLMTRELRIAVIARLHLHRMHCKSTHLISHYIVAETHLVILHLFMLLLMSFFHACFGV